MSQNIRGGKKSKEGEKGDGRCYFPYKRCCTTRPVRILIATTKNNCRKYGHIDGGSNEYCPVVIISYIFIICFYIFYFIYKQLYMCIYIVWIFVIHTNFAWLFVIIKLELPSNFLQNIAPSSSRNDVVQAEEHDQANEDLMEEDDGTNQVNDPMEKNDGKNKMIQDFFAHLDEDGDNDGIYDEPLLEKAK